MKRFSLLLFVLFSLAILVTPLHAADQISYTSSPDEVVVFLNNIAFARDTLSLPGGVDVMILLPPEIYADTLILRENGERVPTYRISQRDGRTAIQWQSASDTDLREVTLEYLLYGISWTPRYDMWLTSDDTTSVNLDFSAEIINGSLTFDEVAMRLVAGQVGTSGILSASETMTMNQAIAGYDRSGAATGAPTGAATIQYIYDISTISAAPGETIYYNFQQSTLPSRRLHLWNAYYDNSVTVIYKVKNETEIPLADGIVRSYEDGLFIGSDYMELTPIGGEGSVTVGTLKNTRVSRGETQTSLNAPWDRDVRHDIELSLTNFGTETVEIEIVDYYPASALEFRFSDEPEHQPGNLLRWEVRLEPGETRTITYQYKD